MIRLDQLHPTWVGHFLFAVEAQGWAEAKINKRGRVTAIPPQLEGIPPQTDRYNLLSHGKGPEVFAQALVLADFATGSKTGADLRESFFKKRPLHGFHFDENVFFENDHRKALLYLLRSNAFATDYLDAQLRSKES
ncbi:hypothetical protein [Erythrobacter sp.]|uniref:hypothetical protein n=1 Tax=Erythrobacter sp. TaxID=1042 RepID=UPI001425D3A6|nr:hypothetical protein [Erythrobacter sp.]QIQ87962.1 MAG: hypothetical protein G9473_15615 [Erythrobacter sp.]